MKAGSGCPTSRLKEAAAYRTVPLPPLLWILADDEPGEHTGFLKQSSNCKKTEVTSHQLLAHMLFIKD